MADVVILGAGPAGTAAAIGFAQAGADVVLLERAATPPFKPGEILEAAAAVPLHELGLFDRFMNLEPLELTGKVSLWDAEDPVDLDAVYNPYGSGFLIDRTALEDWLVGEAQRAGVRVRRGVGRVAARADTNGARTTWLQDGTRHEVRSGLLIEATGRGAGALKTGRRRRFDRLVALLCYLNLPEGEIGDPRLVIEAGASEWWYAAALPKGRAVVALMTDDDLLPKTQSERLNHLRSRLATTRLVRAHYAVDSANATFRAFPAATSQRVRVSGPSWVAVGDAAATFDPLMGLGVAAALAKGTAIARLIAGGDTEHALKRYSETESVTFAVSLADCRALYARVGRYRSNPFWRRRVAPHPTADHSPERTDF